MVAAFGSGALFSLVSGMAGPNPAANALTSGLFFAIVQGGIFQVIICPCTVAHPLIILLSK